MRLTGSILLSEALVSATTIGLYPSLFNETKSDGCLPISKLSIYGNSSWFDLLIATAKCKALFPFELTDFRSALGRSASSKVKFLRYAA